MIKTNELDRIISAGMTVRCKEDGLIGTVQQVVDTCADYGMRVIVLWEVRPGRYGLPVKALAATTGLELIG